MLRNITIRRLSSPASRRVQAVRFDSEKRAVWIRFGWGASFDRLSLVDGRGIGPLSGWRLDDGDLDLLRAAAERDGIRLPPKRPIATPTERERVPRSAQTDPRQLSLLGGAHE